MSVPEPPPDEAIAAVLRSMPEFLPGHVWLTGAGPAGPASLTIEALSGIRRADVIVYDALVDQDIVALARPDARLEFAGKRGGRPSAQQADISARLVTLAQDGLRVLRLKGGDPFIFGRGGEEIFALAKAGIPFRVIAGVTAGLSALTAASIPATMRGINQAIILATGHGAADTGDTLWHTLARSRQPLVIYMAMSNLDAISRALIAGGLPSETPTALIASAGLPKQRVLVSTLASVVDQARAESMEPPAILVVGAIVALRQQLMDLVNSHPAGPQSTGA